MRTPTCFEDSSRVVARRSNTVTYYESVPDLDALIGVAAYADKLHADHSDAIVAGMFDSRDFPLTGCVHIRTFDHMINGKETTLFQPYPNKKLKFVE